MIQEDANCLDALLTLGVSPEETLILGCLLSEACDAKTLSKKTSLSARKVSSIISYFIDNHIVQKKNNQFCLVKENILPWIEERKQNSITKIHHAKLEIENKLLTEEESSWKPKIYYYEGKEGIVEIYKDLLQTSKNIYGWVNIEKIHNTLGEFVYEYIKERNRLGIRSHSVMPFNSMNLSHNNEKENRSARFIEGLDIDGEIRIYGNKVGIITFDGDTPAGFVFEGEKVAQLFKTIFKAYWNRE